MFILSKNASNKLFAIIKLVRPRQWVKNGFVFIPFLFGDKLTDLKLLTAGIIVFIAFCFASGSIYTLNDLSDIEFDRRHPEKKDRPLAAKKVSTRTAALIMVLFGSLAVVMGFWHSNKVGLVVVLFIILNIFYSMYFKNIVLLDIFCIALGFLLRIIAGIYACTVPPSKWIVIMALAIALFLAVGKRRADLLTADENIKNHRIVLKSYCMRTVDQMIVILAAMIIITYSLYATSDYVIDRYGTEAMIYTIPLVIYGLFRYLYVVNDKGSTGDPTKILLSDSHLFLCVLAWLVLCGTIIYGNFKFIIW
jgi:4-hydroxybenzoate polyprenyltransferase